MELDFISGQEGGNTGNNASRLERSDIGDEIFGYIRQVNPENIALKINVVKFNIYRRAQGSGAAWVAVGSVTGSVLSFADTNGITPSSNFEYAVTAVNDKGIESRIQDVGTVAAVDARNGESKAQLDHAAREIQ